ncbi:DUF6153 family protein [Streptomyces roseoviridis]|uniref:DUF6153 family protein n=1 Tax=Streptomyces roseoviridis TaxID=67361 RepID=A0ABV5QTT8_9ACTN
MSADRTCAGQPKRLRLHVLLVLAVLLGLLGMHAMGPVPAIAQASGSSQPAVVVIDAATEHCDHDCSGHGAPGDHADPTCATAALAASVSLPPLTPTVICPAEPAAGLVIADTAAADGGRAPPSLAELQLLRI